MATIKSIEEKAKAYDEVREKIAIRFGSNVADEIFSQFEMSEDERIRKELIRMVKEDWPVRGDVIAWLEKQGETFTNKDLDDAYLKGVCDAKQELEKQGEQNLIMAKSPQLGEQNPTDKVEPKFKVGNWIVDKLGNTLYVKEVYDSFSKVIDRQYRIYNYDNQSMNKSCHLWTIQDAKDGDVLEYVTDEGDLWLMIYQSLYKPYEGHVHYHALLYNNNFTSQGTCVISINDAKPATKEQRDALMKAMADVGYTFDFEKKEFKLLITNGGDFESENCEQNPAWSEEDEKAINDIMWIIEAYRKNGFNETHMQVADNSEKWIKSLKDRIQPQPRQEWSKEDENMYRKLHNLIYSTPYCDSRKELSDFLDSLKNRLQSNLQQEWTEEDEKCIRLSTDIIDSALRAGFCVQLDRDRCVDWLKSLRPQNTWKPSDEQMLAVQKAMEIVGILTITGSKINSLYQDLKKLKG